MTRDIKSRRELKNTIPYRDPERFFQIAMPPKKIVICRPMKGLKITGSCINQSGEVIIWQELEK